MMSNPPQNNKIIRQHKNQTKPNHVDPLTRLTLYTHILSHFIHHPSKTKAFPSAVPTALHPPALSRPSLLHHARPPPRETQQRPRRHRVQSTELSPPSCGREGGARNERAGLRECPRRGMSVRPLPVYPNTGRANKRLTDDSTSSPGENSNP